MAFVVLSFVMTVTLVFGAYWLFVVRPEQEVQSAFWRRLRTKRPDGPLRGGGLLKQAKRLSAVPSLDSLLDQSRRVIGPTELLIEQSGVRITVGAFLLASGLCAVATALVAVQLTGMPLAALAGLPAALIPTSVLRMKRTRRVLRFEEQFPEALALISRALRAGHTFTTGLAMVAEEMPAPIGPEFRLLYDHQNYGMPMEDALKDFARRIPLLDARFFVTAVLIQREAGGNLAEVLDNIGSVIRDRFRVKRQIRVISAHARLTGWVLVAVPPSLAFVLFLINPEHWKTLSGSDLGVRLIILAITLQVIGTLIIRRMVRLEY